VLGGVVANLLVAEGLQAGLGESAAGAGAWNPDLAARASAIFQALFRRPSILRVYLKLGLAGCIAPIRHTSN
jgi:hypothetical protein